LVWGKRSESFQRLDDAEQMATHEQTDSEESIGSEPVGGGDHEALLAEEVPETDGIEPLIKAVIEGGKSRVEALISSGANLNDDELHHMPLHEATRLADKEIMRLLMRFGADVNAKDKRRRTPLHAAVLHENLTIALLLIRCGADVNENDQSSVQLRTPLGDAAGYGNEGVVRLRC
jgi:ankyrin repeat protein